MTPDRRLTCRLAESNENASGTFNAIPSRQHADGFGLNRRDSSQNLLSADDFRRGQLCAEWYEHLIFGSLPVMR